MTLKALVLELPQVGPLIDLHRELYADDLAIPRLVSRQPPTTLNLDTGDLKAEPAAQTGMPMSGRLLRFLSGQYGSEWPWVCAYAQLRRTCRTEHRKRGHTGPDRPYWRGSLCHEAVKLVVIGAEAASVGPMSLAQASAVLRVDRLDMVLLEAFRLIEEEMDAARTRAVKQEAMLAAHVPLLNAPPEFLPSHAQGGLHQNECPKCAVS